ncbi:hypothetical protein P7C73_g1393, partial [Tremellales sp. Uapishka_1]
MTTSPPGSLSALLDWDPRNPPSALPKSAMSMSERTRQSEGPEGDVVNEAALLNYLHNHYQDADTLPHTLDSSIPPLPLPLPAQPPTMLDPALSSQPSSSQHIPSPAPKLDPSERGEMGGKRKKPLHERAGWKEMGEMAKKKRGNGHAGDFVGRGPEMEDGMS